MKTIWSDRSRTEAYQRCPRLRFLSYHENRIGISPVKEALPLVVGKSVHRGLETLLRGVMDGNLAPSIVRLEDAAVAAALADFSQYRSALALDTTEMAAMTPVAVEGGFDAQVAAQARELGLAEDDPQVRELFERQRNAGQEFEQWLYAEQAALVEGMVRAYARRRLRPLLEEFEVLEVEREGDWELGSGDTATGDYTLGIGTAMEPWSIRFMSRPDALLRSRADNSLYLQSYKTAATWDVRKARDAEHDMQGLSEGVEVERRLGEWWQRINAAGKDMSTNLWAMCNQLKKEGCSQSMHDYLMALPAPPRILGIRYEYMLKGTRWEDKDLTRRFGLNVWSQRSPLIRRYVAHSTPSRGKNAGGFTLGDQCWSWDLILDDGSSSKLSASNWHSEPVWEPSGRDGSVSGVKAWIDLLDDSQMAMSAEDSTVGLAPRELGWKSAAQALGFTARHPLDEVFPAPMTVYRSDDDLRDWIESTEAQETRVAESVARIEAAEDEGERRHLLNVLMPMSRRSCSYPTECVFAKTVCYAGADAKANPLASGAFKLRTPNHIAEREAVAAAAIEAER
ncbi:MAG TPA: PD-(D/E)XK nuclease family protein [Blastocatellia bacterium]|nr:PD-(D/E)XK nuclease family protein [Blastocatellia bacterium]